MSTFNKRHWRTVRLVLAFLSFTLGLLAFSGYAHYAPLKFQATPSLLSALALPAAGTLVMFALLVLVTYFTGRVYCSCFCLLGIAQDLLGWLGHRLRIVLGGLALGLALSGSAAFFLELDPYSIFGRMIMSLSLGTFLPFVVLLAVAAYHPRIFCKTICPVGALLGFISRFSPRKLTLSDACIRCGKCTKVCPVNAIDIKQGTINNELCLRCMNCVGTCPKEAIGFGKEKRLSPTAAKKSRRDFLINAGILTVGTLAGATAIRLFRKSGTKRLQGLDIIPPGAGSPERLVNKCTGCLLCLANCPQKIIVKARNGVVALNPSLGSCRYDCNRCTQVCPTGAITPLTLQEKQRTKIATVEFEPAHCMLFDLDYEGTCAKCTEVCPAKAITPIKGADGRLFPRFNLARCIGCGKCVLTCPATPKAITLKHISRQVTVNPQLVALRNKQVVTYDPMNCLIALEGTKCGKCTAVCPTGALTMKRMGKRGPRAPFVTASYCLACRACEKVCPATPKAIAIGIPNPEEEF